MVQDAAMGERGEVDGVAEEIELVRGFEGAADVQGVEERCGVDIRLWG